jgi:chromosome segregation ATPase
MRLAVCLLLVWLAGCSSGVNAPASTARQEEKRPLQEKLDAEQKLANEAQRKLTADINAANAVLAEEHKKIESLAKEQEELTAEKEKLAKDLDVAIAELEVVPSSLKEDNEKTEAAQGTVNAANMQDIACLKKDIKERFEKITIEIGQIKNVDQLLKGEYIALRNDVNQAMEPGNITEAELNKLSDRSKIFQLRVITTRAKEAEQFARKMLQAD